MRSNPHKATSKNPSHRRGMVVAAYDSACASARSGSESFGALAAFVHELAQTYRKSSV